MQMRTLALLHDAGVRYTPGGSDEAMRWRHPRPCPAARIAITGNGRPAAARSSGAGRYAAFGREDRSAGDDTGDDHRRIRRRRAVARCRSLRGHCAPDRPFTWNFPGSPQDVASGQRPIVNVTLNQVDLEKLAHPNRTNASPGMSTSQDQHQKGPKISEPWDAERPIRRGGRRVPGFPALGFPHCG